MLTASEPPTRLCLKCRQFLSIDEFNRSSEFGWQFYCRKCQSAWYRENRADHIANVSANTKRYRRRNVDLVREYLLGHPCVDCGESDPDVLEFDHMRDKEHLVSRLKHVGAAANKIFSEIAKCEVRCVNCHLRRTAVQFGWRRAEAN